MPLFRRQQTATLEDPAGATRSAGARPCDARGCASYDVARCGYIDRRSRRCAAAFCSQHYVTIGDVAYCRRHAGTIKAIGERSQDSNARPDLNDRSPSLVGWISRDLDKSIRQLLTRSAGPGEKVVADDAVTLAHDVVNRRARWERSWRLVESTGVIIKVTIHVAEQDDSMVHVRVGTEMVADGVPPWIANRREGHELTASTDESQRRLFYRFLEENIGAAVNRFRARGDRPDWSHPATA